MDGEVVLVALLIISSYCCFVMSSLWSVVSICPYDRCSLDVSRAVVFLASVILLSSSSRSRWKSFKYRYGDLSSWSLRLGPPCVVVSRGGFPEVSSPPSLSSAGRSSSIYAASMRPIMKSSFLRVTAESPRRYRMESSILVTASPVLGSSA